MQTKCMFLWFCFNLYQSFVKSETLDRKRRIYSSSNMILFSSIVVYLDWKQVLRRQRENSFEQKPHLISCDRKLILDHKSNISPYQKSKLCRLDRNYKSKWRCDCRGSFSCSISESKLSLYLKENLRKREFSWLDHK